MTAIPSFAAANVSSASAPSVRLLRNRILGLLDEHDFENAGGNLQYRSEALIGKFPD
jgi:hypothetical protein